MPPMSVARRPHRWHRAYRVWQSEQSLLAAGLPHASHGFDVGVAIACVCPFFGWGDAEELVCWFGSAHVGVAWAACRRSQAQAPEFACEFTRLTVTWAHELRVDRVRAPVRADIRPAALLAIPEFRHTRDPIIKQGSEVLLAHFILLTVQR